jgi:hypothetical protein
MHAVMDRQIKSSTAYCTYTEYIWFPNPKTLPDRVVNTLITVVHIRYANSSPCCHGSSTHALVLDKHKRVRSPSLCHPVYAACVDSWHRTARISSDLPDEKGTQQLVWHKWASQGGMHRMYYVPCRSSAAAAMPCWHVTWCEWLTGVLLKLLLNLMGLHVHVEWDSCN